ncbi:unnamed protein product [Phaedon cochleariae]|uniref:Peptidoglycan-recognition protein n=1 Tax=Phaedon cochleariae TaxID=80249 RepID=A0A9P0GP78_PHACE|nr:unnamed protein product [Phaedon cochleariae]
MWFDKILLLVYLASSFHEITCKCPSMISREKWNASAPVSVKPLSLNPPPFIVVHHSATQSCETEAACRKLVKSIQIYHIVDNQWEDIGYNFLIGGDGQVYEGRGWGIHGAHVKKYNNRSLGICLLGNYQDNEPPTIQIQTLKDLIRCAVEENKTIDHYHLIGHRQGSATLCPGEKLFRIIESWPDFDHNPQ